ncbi:MAG: TolC family protein [Saprospiraceae bacterium]|nr:TolC family protein [Saprospiraceae bacterium]
MQKIIITSVLFGFSWATVAQTTPEAAVAAALQQHPSVKAASMEVQAKKQAERASLDLSNPEVNMESPTGEFYAVGVLQSFDFPTVYKRRKQAARAETGLARAEQRLSENELRYTVRRLYLETQVAAYNHRQWAIRDSLYQQIAGSALRQFEAGEIDFLQKTMAEIEAGKVRQDFLAARQSLERSRQQLSQLTGIAELGNLTELEADTTAQTVASENAPVLAYQQQAIQVAEQQIRLAKSRALPGFSIGYLNQGPRETPLDYRFCASVGIPLWAGQYSAGRKAAEIEAQAVQHRSQAAAQTLELEWERTRSEINTYLGQLRYYQTTALPQSRSLRAAALRLRDAGQLDYPAFLRSLDEAWTLQSEYANLIENLNNAQLYLRYLAGE